MGFLFDASETPAQQRQRIAANMVEQGMQTTPIASPWQGVARLAQTLVGSNALSSANSDQQDAMKQYYASLTGQPTPAAAPKDPSLVDRFTSLLSGNQSQPAQTGPAAPLPSGATPASSAPSAGQDAILNASAAGNAPVPALAQARAGFSTELQDPATAARLAAITHAEVGSQGPAAQQAFVESVMNRAASRGQSLGQTLTGNYFPSTTYAAADQAMANPQALGQYAPIIKNALGGSNVSGFATGNASGTVGFNGGPQTSAYNGERFGVEGPDQKWASGLQAPAAQAPGQAAINANMPGPVASAPLGPVGNPGPAPVAPQMPPQAPPQVPQAAPSPQAGIASALQQAPQSPAPSQQDPRIAGLVAALSNQNLPPEMRAQGQAILSQLMVPQMKEVTRPDGSLYAYNPLTGASRQVLGPQKTDSIVEGPTDPNTGLPSKLVWNAIDGVKGRLNADGSVSPIGAGGPQPTPTAPGGILPPPPGADPKEYRQTAGKLAATENMPTAAGEQEFSSKITALPSYKEYSAAIPTFNAFTQHIQDNSPASDKAIVDDFAKILNPGRSVTTGAFNLNMDAQSVPAKLYADMEKAFNGNGELGPDARAQMARIAEIKMNEYKSAWGTDQAQQSKIAKAHNLKIENVIPDLPAQKAIDYTTINSGKTTAATGAPGMPPNAATPLGTPKPPQLGEIQNGYRYVGGDPGSQNSWSPQ